MSCGSKRKKTNTAITAATATATATAADEGKFFLKVMINKEKTKVLFLEADSDFADVLLSFLTLPLGTIVRIFEKHYGDETIPVFGSLNSLRKGLRNLNDVHFWTWSGKEMLLNPTSLLGDENRKLKVNVDDTLPTKYFTCGDWNCKKKGGTHYVSMYYWTSTCNGCGTSLYGEISTRKANTRSSINNGVFTRKTSWFLISDDLQIMPNVPGSMIQTLNNLGITDIDGSELRTVTVGSKEVIELLKGSLLSQTPLTDFFLNKEHQIDSATAQFEELGISLNQMETNTSSNSTKMIVKAMVQKSTNKLLFLQAEEDFVDFLFSLLTIPLGGIVRLLGCKTSLGSVDNFYRSIENLDGDKHMKNPDTKEGLLNPMLSPMYGTENRIFPLNEQKLPALYYYANYEKWTEFVSPHPKIYADATKVHTRDGSLICFVDPKGWKSFVKRPGVFLVTDDLTVVPSCITSSFSILNGLKIPLSDVGEQEINIGLKEGLSILKASLTSTSALTNGLHSILKKKPKQELSV